MVIIKNITTQKEITKFIEELNVTSPKINTVSSLEVNFNLFENLIKDDDVININIDDLFIFEGKAKVTKLTKNYKLQDIYSISVFDEMEKYYTKKVSEDFTKFDVYLCNNTDVNNSLLHIIAEQLGVVGIFDEVKYEDGSYIKVPFVVFEKDTRYIDLLQTYIKATDGYLYFSNGKLFFKLNNFSVLESFIIDDVSIINEVQESQKTTEYNGIKVLFDNFKILDTQKVFKLSEKIVVEPNTANPEIMKINYSTSSAMNVNLTKATGYYFTSEDVKSKVVVNLLGDINCRLIIDKIGSLGVEIKIINRLPYKLYVDNIEIIGNPLVKYEDNESKIIKTGVLEKEENLFTIEKNSYIQAEKHSKYIAKREYQKNIASKYNYKFNTILTNGIELGRIYNIKIGEINKLIQINSVDIKINLNEKYMTFTGEEITELVEVIQKNKFVANPTGEFLQLKNLEKEIDEEKAKNQELEQKINAKMITSITEPKEDINNNDIWYNPQDNTFKKYFEGVWVAIQEKELLPAMKHWASLENAKIKMGELDKKAGLFLINEGEKFGTINGTLAEVTLDRQGSIVLKNANNLLEWNVKNPANPSQITSRLLMGVTDVDKVDEDVYFKIGDGATGFGLEFRKGMGVGNATFNGLPLETKFLQMEETLAWQLAEQNRENKETIKQEVNKGIDDVTFQFTESNRINNIRIEGMNNKINTTTETVNKINTDLTNKIDGLTKTITFEVGGNADIYYPVLIRSDNYEWCGCQIFRHYNEKAPATWNTPTHMGALFLEVQTDFRADWSGSPNNYIVTKFDEVYSKMASKLMRVHSPGVLVWLRGGGAVYHCTTNNIKSNQTLSAKIYMNGYDALGEMYDTRYPQTDIGKIGTYDETGAGKTIRDLCVQDRLSETERGLVDANGKYTTLQQNYNNISKDVTNFKTQTTSNLDTITTALQKGNFIVTGNTVFDGSATVISRGASERIQINGGSIDFFRTVGGVEKKLSTIKNIRYGVINTDSKGKGVVNFDGFKQPMLVFTTIKAINLGKNIASMFCYAEHVSGTTYRFYVGGTNEIVKEATPIKVLGTSWKMSNAMETTLLGITGNIETVECKTPMKKDYSGLPQAGGWVLDPNHQYEQVLKIPKFRVKVLLLKNGVAETVFSKDYQLSFYKTNWQLYEQRNLSALNFTQDMNILKKMINRTNIEYQLKIEILEPNYVLKGYYAYRTSQHYGGKDNGGYSTTYHYGAYDETKPVFTLTPAHLKNLSITASAQTSTIVDSSGTGDVSYIAMEVD